MRLYNGCPDSELQALIDSRASAQGRLTKADPKARCTYFPMEEKYLVFVDLKPIGEMHFDMIQAIDAAIKIIKER